MSDIVDEMGGYLGDGSEFEEATAEPTQSEQLEARENELRLMLRPGVYVRTCPLKSSCDGDHCKYDHYEPSDDLKVYANKRLAALKDTNNRRSDD